MRPHLAAAFVLSAAVLMARAAPLAIDITRADIERAMSIGRGPEQDRARFHAPYRSAIADASIERLEVITEYRRMVLIVEERLAAGEFAFATNTRLAEDALRPWRRKVSIRARIRFNPLNVFREVPRVSVILADDPAPLVPMHVMSDPQYALGNYPAGFAPLIGVLVEADFDGAAIGQRTLPVLLHIQGAPDVRAVVNFGSMR